MAKDIEGNTLSVGDEVYYARKDGCSAKGELVKVYITKISPETGLVKMGKYSTRTPEAQILKRV